MHKILRKESLPKFITSQWKTQEKKKQRNYKTKNYKQNGNTEFIPIYNYFK
jgi:hypothetical protein